MLARLVGDVAPIKLDDVNELTVLLEAFNAGPTRAARGSRRRARVS